MAFLTIELHSYGSTHYTLKLLISVAPRSENTATF